MIITARAKAFPCETARKYKFLVTTDGNFHVMENAPILVWDSVAVHFTRCHCLSESAIARIRKAAKAKAADEYRKRTQTIEPRNHGEFLTFETSLQDHDGGGVIRTS